MGIEAVNHYLSSWPVVDAGQVHAVRREAGQESQASQELQPEKPIVIWPQAKVDTLSKAQVPYFFVAPRATPSRLTVAESCAILARIDREKTRVDYLSDFPGLLKV